MRLGPSSISAGLDGWLSRSDRVAATHGKDYHLMSISPFLAARIGGWILWEKLAGYRAEYISDVPQSAETMTPRWLTAVLCRGVSGAEVSSVETTGGSDGTTSRRAISLTYNAVGMAAGLPTKLFTKCTPHFRSRLQQAAIAKPPCEVGFYNEIRRELDIEATDTLFAAYEPRSGRTVMIFRDIAAEGVRFLDIFDYVTRDMAEQIVRTMAGYHGQMWRDPRLSTGYYPWLRSVLTYQRLLNDALPYEARSYVGMERAHPHFPAELAARPNDVWLAHMRSVEICCDPGLPQTLIHWDVHIGNWYLTPAGKMGLTDWNMNTGNWATDYSYAIVTALTSEDRAAWERDLLALYIEELKARGVIDVPSFDEAWLAYRQQMFHALFYWTFPLGIGSLQPRMQLPEISLRNVERSGQAIVELESMKAVGF
jgi:thiamine kinase-like enzyme